METNTIEKHIARANSGRALNVLGDNQAIKFDHQTTNGCFTMLTQKNPPGVQIPRHVHSLEDEVIAVVTGEIEFDVAGSTSILTAGDTIFLPKNVPHSFKVVGADNATTMVFSFPSGIEKMFEELADLPAGEPNFGDVAAICGRYGISFQ